MPRLFFGLDLPTDAKNRLASIQATLRRHGVIAQNWTASDLFHVTVSFLGETDDSWLDKLEAAAIHTASQTDPFVLNLDAIGAFARNRVLWVGLAEDAGHAALVQLNARLQRALADVGWVGRDGPPYRPHVTIARKLFVETLSDDPEAACRGDLPFAVHAARLCLFESTRVDGRLSYPVRRRFRFGHGRHDVLS